MFKYIDPKHEFYVIYQKQNLQKIDNFKVLHLA